MFTMYEVWGRYSPDQPFEYLEEFDNPSEADDYVVEFEKVYGRYAYVDTRKYNDA